MNKHKWVAVIASCDREEWLRGRSCAPADILEEAIRALGLTITSRRLGKAHGRLDVTGGAIVINSLLPSILDYRTDAKAVETWTLAHELGHYRLHRAQLQRGERNPEQERQAHAYAACFLLPRTEVVESLQFQELLARRIDGTLTPDRRKDLAVQLGKRYRVTPAAVLVRFEELLPLQRHQVSLAPERTGSSNVLTFAPRPAQRELTAQTFAARA